MSADENEKAGDRTAAAQDRRKARLAGELRANLQRRKAQTRARRSGDADARPDGLGENPDGAERDAPR